MWVPCVLALVLSGCFAFGLDFVQPDTDGAAGDGQHDAGADHDGGQQQIDASVHHSLDGSALDASVFADAAPDAATVLPCVGVDCDLACPDNDHSCFASCTGSKKCKLRCGKGARCELACRSGEDCKCECGPDALCDIHCSDAKKCKVHCAPGSRCDTDCSVSDCSKAECEDSASCLLTCREGSTCDFGICRAPTMCPGNIAVCNRPCP